MKVRLGVPAIVSLVLAAALPALAQEPYEGPAAFTPAEVLRADLVGGPHYTLAGKVETKGYLYEFVVQSDYGSFPAEGTGMLFVRLREVQALAALDEVSKSEVFLSAAGTSVLNVGKSVGKAVADPAGTVKGVGAGLKSYGENLGRKAKRTAETAADAMQSDEKTKAEAPGGTSTTEKAVDAGTSVAKSYFGVTGASRRWAQKLGVDPYTSNPVLRKALEDIGTIDAAGGIAAKAVVPIPTAISTGADVSNLVWGKDPEELLKLNEQRLAEMSVDKAVAAAFFKSQAFSPSQQTRFVAALYAVRAAGCADYVDAAREAGAEVEAEFFTESAEMLAALHTRNRVEAVLTDSRAMVALVGDKRAVALLPLDWIRWTEASRKALTEIAGRARKELGASRLEIELTGRMSPRALEESQAIGWNVSQGAPGPVAPPKPAGTP
jgi:hypothetical protein